MGTDDTKAGSGVPDLKAADLADGKWEVFCRGCGTTWDDGPPFEHYCEEMVMVKVPNDGAYGIALQVEPIRLDQERGC